MCKEICEDKYTVNISNYLTKNKEIFILRVRIKTANLIIKKKQKKS
jgi:hypothetical protein